MIQPLRVRCGSERHCGGNTSPKRKRVRTTETTGLRFGLVFPLCHASPGEAARLENRSEELVPVRVNLLKQFTTNFLEETNS